MGIPDESELSTLDLILEEMKAVEKDIPEGKTIVHCTAGVG